MLDRQLADHQWLAADRLTIADIVGFASLDFGRMIKLQIPDNLPHVIRWMDAMRTRPAAQAGMTSRT